MTKRKKLLWSGDIVAMTGFARVTENVLEHLRHKYDVVCLGNNWWGDYTPWQEKVRMYPSSNRFQQEPFGVQRIKEVVNAEKPDVVLVMNDIWNINNIYGQIKEEHQRGDFVFIGYSPQDSYEWTGAICDTANDWDGMISYTEFGAMDWHNSGVQKPISIIPHGCDLSTFHPMDKLECRAKLGIDPDSFIVFNGNRNQARKRIDITIDAFARFCSMNPEDTNIKLYLHMGMKDQGWDIMPLFGRIMSKYGIDPNHRIVMTAQNPSPPNISIEMLNLVYNAADVGINTCKGEGWGLVNFEHAACQVPQIVPNHTSCKEIFEGYGLLINNLFDDYDMNLNRRMPIPNPAHAAELLHSLYADEDYRREVGKKCYERVSDEQFSWPVIAEQFEEVIEEVCKEKEEKLKAAEPVKKTTKPKRRIPAGVK
jgi:D-inositol-3-phosphate glycosyltransferase